MHGFVDHGPTGDEVAQIRGRSTLIPGSDDPWVDQVTVAATAARSSDRVRVRVVESDRHLFHEDPELTIRLIGTMLDEIDRIHADAAGQLRRVHP